MAAVLREAECAALGVFYDGFSFLTGGGDLRPAARDFSVRESMKMCNSPISQALNFPELLVGLVDFTLINKLLNCCK